MQNSTWRIIECAKECKNSAWRIVSVLKKYVEFMRSVYFYPTRSASVQESGHTGKKTPNPDRAPV